MVCEKFKNYSPRERKNELLKRINEIIADYTAKGYMLTVRQVFYQLVSRNIIVNSQSEYDSLTELIANARMSGQLDWNAVEDWNRSTYVPYYVSDMSDAIEDTLRQYRLDRLRNQDTYIEVMIEKMAIYEIIREVTAEYGIRLTGDKGNCSVTLLYEISKRLIRACNEGKRCVILYIGDHDPSGRAMDDNIVNKLTTMGVPEFEFRRIALTQEQAIQYNLPPNQLKEKDSNSKKYKEICGDSGWECDALPTNVLQDILYHAIWELIDFDKFWDVLKQEEIEKQQLQGIIDSWRMTSNYNAEVV